MHFYYKKSTETVSRYINEETSFPKKNLYGIKYAMQLSLKIIDFFHQPLRNFEHILVANIKSTYSYIYHRCHNIIRWSNRFKYYY